MAQPVTAPGRGEAGVVTLGTWEAGSTTVAEVDRAVTALRRAEQRAAVRTAVLTLVVVTAGEDEAAAAVEVVHALGGRHPSRTLVLAPGGEGEAGLDGEARLHAVERDGRTVCFEDVLLRVRGPALDHLDSVVEPLSLADLPVVLWYPRGRPRPDDPLVAVADRVVVDLRELGGREGPAAALRQLVPLARRVALTDLSWVRLAPWRELLAGLFEGPVFRPFVAGVRTARVAARPGPRQLLGGWLASRLGLDRAQVTLSDAPFASIELDAVHGGRAGRFVVRRRGDEREVEAAVDVEGGPAVSRMLRLRERSAARVLGQAMGLAGRDPVYEEALVAGTGLAG